MTVQKDPMEEMMTRPCCNVGCDKYATHRVFWPGQGAKEMCDEHTGKARNIANAMGFTVHTHPLND
jgi:hypothetical protein